MLGVELPAHARPCLGAVLTTAAAVCLILWLAPTAALLAILGSADVFSEIATFFFKMAVGTYGWMAPGEMLDGLGLGLAETTPGPLIMVTQFVGFLGAYRDPGSLPPLFAGVLGAC